MADGPAAATKGKTMSERAVDRLEEKGYLKNVRAEMRAEVMKCLVDMEDQGEIPSELRIKRYTPENDEVKKIQAYIHEFLRSHAMKHTLTCFEHEVNGAPAILPLNPGRTIIARAIAEAIARSPK
jgi:hypothetical protein